MDAGPALAGVQVPPDLSRRVVIRGGLLSARRAGEFRPGCFLDPDVNALRRHVRLDLADQPGILDTEQLGVQLPIIRAATSSFAQEDSLLIAA